MSVFRMHPEQDNPYGTHTEQKTPLKSIGVPGVPGVPGILAQIAGEFFAPKRHCGIAICDDFFQQLKFLYGTYGTYGTGIEI